MDRVNIAKAVLGGVGTAAMVIALHAGLPLLAAQNGGKTASGGTMDVPGALPGIHAVAPLADGQWTTPAGDYGNLRFSPLSQIDTKNVQNLHVVSTMSTGIPHGHEGQPLVVNNTLYVVTPYPNNLIALDLTKPGFPQKWIYRPNPNSQSVGVACCDIVNRGASYADGKIIYNLLDAHTVAVDATSGHEVWRTEVGDIKYGETTTMAPLVVKNVVLVGDSGGELGVRGKLTALDVDTGKILWRAFSTGSDADVLIGPNFKPFYPKDRGKDLGVTSWTPGQWKLGGGTIWGWVSYDPTLDLIYYGTGNPGVWSPDMRPGDNKWSITIWARNPETGQAKWAYQVVPHDAWDYDEIMENVLIDMPWHGQTRKLLLHPGRTGFMFVLDRETGEVLSAEKYEPANWANSYNLKTGLPDIDPDKRTHIGHYTTDICPSSTGAKDYIPSSFDPRTGYLYIPAHNTCMDYKGSKVNYIAGTPYLGASVRMYPGPGGYQGELVAWDVANAKKVWTVKDPDLPVYCGVLSTGGDVVFYGTMEGWFRAVDAHSGKILWQFKTASGIVGDPMTFLGPDGKQYVAIYSGVGGWMGATALPAISNDDPYAALGVVGAMKDIKAKTQPGDLLYVFGL
ncbi:MAG TPA: PQQ-dependent dehydrogenase, methanol/ethanol family [Bryobacteraceae bacterium]|jgi:PQQ-dependent dehydrogenase (methanol/ethanol family)|nr:PQQ-dependent dehydrogenase, methanol/ethanol family [Bryobacteraceae bacterium]